jgi:hypothetical protein
MSAPECERCGGMHKAQDMICPWHPARKPKPILGTLSEETLRYLIHAITTELESRA